MNPEERELLKRAIKLSEENNQILHDMKKAAKWGTIWGFIKLVIVVAPIVIGFLYLSPYFSEIGDDFRELRRLINPESAEGESSRSLMSRFLSG